MYISGLFDLMDYFVCFLVMGDLLEVLDGYVDFEVFCLVLMVVFGYGECFKGGCLLYDLVMMFKVFVLVLMYNLSDE